MTKRNQELEEENYRLRKQLRNVRARLTLTQGERDAARTALNNFNMMEQLIKLEQQLYLRPRGISPAEERIIIPPSTLRHRIAKLLKEEDFRHKQERVGVSDFQCLHFADRIIKLIFLIGD